MAVEARHFNPQLLQIRDLVNPCHQVNGLPAYNQPQMRFPANPFPATMPGNQPFYHHQVGPDLTPAKTSVNTESGLTCNLPASRKRCRDATDEFYASPSFPAEKNTLLETPCFVGVDGLPQIQQYQFEIDAFISQHTKKIKLELQERLKKQTNMLIAAVGERAMQKLKEKDELIQRMVKLNLVLQEKVKSLYIENHLWRDLAQTNEATAISLRTSLEQALAQAGGAERKSTGGAAVYEEEVESCCGSSDDGRGIEGEDSMYNDIHGKNCYNDRRCRQCGNMEACVVLLPCRHLCLCNVCGSGGSHQLQTCPICNSSMNGTLHVNMSSN